MCACTNLEVAAVAQGGAGRADGRGVPPPAGPGQPQRIHRRPEYALQPIAALLERGPVALLCGWADPQRCHRSVAAEFLAEHLGAEVGHILAPERPARLNDQLWHSVWHIALVVYGSRVDHIAGAARPGYNNGAVVSC